MTARAPGRVNLIGEHTDYNQGFVLPIALQLETRITATLSPDGRFHFYSEGRGEVHFDSLPDQRRNHWSDYVVGVARQLPVSPATLHIESTVPEGAGLSSSAALEVASALALLQGREMDKLEIAKLCQRAESEFAGMPCGIMDQYVSLFAQEHAALKIDCRSLESEPVTLPDEVSIIAVNSMVKHQLGDSAYRKRVAECAEACREAGVTSLRDATLKQVRHNKRARHIVTENQRVLDFVAAAKGGDLHRMGELFLESHTSMRDDYEISCKEIDFLVETARKIPGCFGARMTGGGFGGCTVNLVANASVPAFKDQIQIAYPRAQFIQCIPACGACVVNNAPYNHPLTNG